MYAALKATYVSISDAEYAWIELAKHGAKKVP